MRYDERMVLRDDELEAAIAYNDRLATSVVDAALALLVAKFQHESELYVDGKLGPNTQKALTRLLRPSSPLKADFAGWVMPMPATWDGRELAMSSGFAKDGVGPNRDRLTHLGNDFMYRRRMPGRAKHPEYTRGYWCPSKVVPFVSVGPGSVEVAHWANNRFTVIVDHGVVAEFGRLRTWYTHAYELHVEQGQRVLAGDVLGIVGATGTDINHLHFGVMRSDMGRTWKQRNVDPEPFTRSFAKLTKLAT